jgi:hypothetical protein
VRCHGLHRHCWATDCPQARCWPPQLRRTPAYWPSCCLEAPAVAPRRVCSAGGRDSMGAAARDVTACARIYCAACQSRIGKVRAADAVCLGRARPQRPSSNRAFRTWSTSMSSTPTLSHLCCVTRIRRSRTDGGTSNRRPRAIFASCMQGCGAVRVQCPTSRMLAGGLLQRPV